ncbi:MAG TPA: styrene monooxygenase/indole monooxygenase family protein [Thermoanaerobaculia bacterium]|nr:styrene monooxygenase/indole monooxygenase family protein [Thermoanaerobaculia bacterium]
MRKIAIVGAGQAGMVLAFGLLQEGYEVTVFEGRPADEIERGPIMSTAMVFDRQLNVERRLGLHEWEGKAPVCNGMHSTLRLPNGEIILQIQGGLEETCQGVDARIKTSTWLRKFEAQGGKVVDALVGRSLLEGMADAFDLVVVASGKGGLGEVFERDQERSFFDAPPRRLGAVILKGVREWEEIPYTTLKFQYFVQIGEFFAIPFYSNTGPCRAIVFEAPPGSPMDVWGGVDSADKALATALRLIRQYSPEDWPNYRNAQLVDERSWLKGAITPTVRKVAGRLRTGKHVMAMGDVAIVNDPISGTGANDAVRQADRMTRAIVERNGRAFDKDWMEDVFEGYYQERGRYTMEFTRLMTGPMTEPLWKVLQGAAQSPGVAHTFANMFNDIKESLGWMTDMKAAEQVCGEHAQELRGARFLTLSDAMARFAPQPGVKVQAA